MDFLAQLIDLESELILLALFGFPPRREEIFLPGKGHAHMRAVKPRCGLRWEGDFDGLVAFGFEPRLARDQLVEAGIDDRQIGAGRGLIEPEKQLSGIDPAAVGNQDFSDDAAFIVLDFLGVGLHDHAGLGNYRAADRGKRGPAAEAAKQEQ
jgi:hypothetical protein